MKNKLISLINDQVLYKSVENTIHVSYGYRLYVIVSYGWDLVEEISSNYLKLTLLDMFGNRYNTKLSDIKKLEYYKKVETFLNGLFYLFFR